MACITLQCTTCRRAAPISDQLEEGLECAVAVPTGWWLVAIKATGEVIGQACSRACAQQALE